MLWVPSLLCTLVTLVATTFGAKCPLTEVPQYQYGCGVQGLIRRPSVLSIDKNITTKEGCWELCLDNRKCRSVRWVEETSKCYLYDKYLDQMFTDLSNYQSGILWERECWTRNCNIIDSCAASEPCRMVYSGYFIYDVRQFSQYACSYGKTSMSSTRDGRPYPIDSITLINGSLSACDALQSCPRPSEIGTLDVHFHIPSKQWVCIRYDDNDTNGGTPSIATENVYRTRYSEKNDTVGAGYGFKYDGICPYYYC